jgi:NADH:ubiquinone oxidoreductase subunit
MSNNMMDQAARISYTVRMSTSEADAKVKADAKVSLGQLGGLGGFIRNPGLVLFTLRHGRPVGQDAVGNRYFECAGRGKVARSRRWVVYAGGPDASTVAPEWHAWLHRLTDAPLAAAGAKPWQRPHKPNLTGTPDSYRPAGHDYAGGKRARGTGDYESWTPDQG